MYITFSGLTMWSKEYIEKQLPVIHRERIESSHRAADRRMKSEAILLACAPDTTLLILLVGWFEREEKEKTNIDEFSERHELKYHLEAYSWYDALQKVWASRSCYCDVKDLSEVPLFTGQELRLKEYIEGIEQNYPPRRIQKKECLCTSLDSEDEEVNQESGQRIDLNEDMYL